MIVDLNLMNYCPEYFEIKIRNFRKKNLIYKSYLPFAMCLKMSWFDNDCLFIYLFLKVKRDLET